MTNQEALSIVRQSENPNVLLMLSGGKDSSACLHMFVQAGIQVTAIHFKHKWGSTISTGEAQRRCREWSVEFLEIDISERFLDTIKGYRGGRPCLLCKPVMYEYVINELETGNYGWICIGDNADDKTTIMRIDDYTQDRPLENEYISRYFGSERGVVLPDKVRVVRPIIEWPVEDIEEYLAVNGVSIEKNHSTGDKYFEYAREGCPVQFHDPGYPITEDTLNDLYHCNMKLREFAKERNIRASIHLPTGFVVTIPQGHERDAIRYLESCQIDINRDVNSDQYPQEGIVSILGKLTNLAVFSDGDTGRILYYRFLERIGTKATTENVHKTDHTLCTVYECEQKTVIFLLDMRSRVLSVTVTGTQLPSKELIKNLMVEIFRTRQFRVAIFDGLPADRQSTCPL
jgi:tRNA(Ile)-lysidine synthase TilS/MesJ